MNKIILPLLFLITACAPKSVITICSQTRCEQAGINNYIKDCMADVQIFSTSDEKRYWTDCDKNAREIYCKKINGVTVNGKFIPCDSIYGKNKTKYCK